MSEPRPRVTVVDYGLGNLFSLKRAVERIGCEALISGDPDTVLASQALILPGVGAFGDGMKGLAARGLIGPIRRHAASGKPLLGICLGMQLLATSGEEFGPHEGLDLVRGRVVRFPALVTDGPRFKVPNIGWCPLELAVDKPRGLLAGLATGDCVYFVHSYIFVPEGNGAILARTRYAGVDFCSVLQQGNIMGCQFHPEKSAEKGLAILANFLGVGRNAPSPAPIQEG